ncbi:MAG: helix-turn-helix domain-containing protein [Cytophagales bacterium]|nr:helix-turn-helix domain-containing protein [Cytophagales bacterium]
MIGHLNTSPKGGFNQPIPFQIRALTGKAVHPGERPAEPGRTTAFEIIWVRKGAGHLLVDLTRHVVRENTLFYLAPGQMRQLQTSAPTEGYVISFTESFLGEEEAGFGLGEYAGLIDQFRQHPIMRLGEELAYEIGDIAGKLLKEYNNFFPQRSEMLRRYVKIMLIHLGRQLEPASGVADVNRQPVLVRKFIALLEKQFREKKMVAEYAGQLAVSPNYLNESVKKTFGCPASHLIRQRIVLEAKRKALYSDANMKEVAYSLGFEDVAHFSRFFKNTAGVNFTDFRKDTARPNKC